MKTLNFTGVHPEGAKKVSKELAQLLADIQIFYTNLRGFHWNIVGKQFFKLHEKFEELYDDVNEKADEIAERMLMLGETPENRFSEYVKIANVPEVSNVSGAEESIDKVLEGLKILIAQEKKVMEVAAEVGDEASEALMSDYIREQEKLVWMYVATRS
ncbi:MAG: Dps family protein [Bacteroidales bacterium]